MTQERVDMKILITGGAGFIGSALIRHCIKNTDHEVLNIDNLTYAGNLDSLKNAASSDRYNFKKINICDPLDEVFNFFKPDAVMHLAAESHVDKSIDSPDIFIEANIVGTFNILEVSRTYWGSLKDSKKDNFSETIHGYEIEDSYRWLEDFTSEESKDWVKRQNQFTQKFIGKDKYKKSINNNLSKIWETESLSTPYKIKGKTFYYFNDGSWQQSKLMVKDCEDCEGRVLLDPNKFSTGCFCNRFT